MTVPDGVEKVEIGFPGETFTAPVENNVAPGAAEPVAAGCR